MMSIRPRRSVLYMPATNARAMEKAKTLKADVIIFDMEDSVGPDAKVEARDAACDAVNSGGYGMREVVLRVNDLESEWGRDDIAAAAVSGADAILVPKIYHPDDIKETVKIMKAAGAPDDMPLWVMMETPAAILRADAIAGAYENIECLVVGSNDLVSELQAQHSSDRLAKLTALIMTVVAAQMDLWCSILSIMIFLMTLALKLNASKAGYWGLMVKLSFIQAKLMLLMRCLLQMMKPYLLPNAK